MKWMLVALAGIIAAGFIIAIIGTSIGAMLPRDHVSTRTATFRQPRARLFAIARDFANQPTWRHGLLAVELLPSDDGQTGFRERSRRRAVTYRVVEDQPPARLALEIVDTNLPYGGTWTMDFAEAPSGSTLTITERGVIKPALFRFLARFVFGHASSIEQYLKDLGGHVGEGA